MKFKLNPLYAYIIGMWHASPSKKGIGVCGDAAPFFAKLCFELNISKKMLQEGDCIFFYHSKLKKFFTLILNERKERFKYLNDFSSSYFGGIFESSGRIENEKIVIRGDEVDEFILHSFRFSPIKKFNRIIIRNSLAFAKFIKDKIKFKKNLLKEI